MKVQREAPSDETQSSGFGVLDEKGRLSLPKLVRTALGIHPGSAVAYVVLDGAVLLIPQDEYLSELMRNAERALSSAGLTAQDIIDALPEARAEVIREHYGDTFLQELQDLWTQYHGEDTRR